MIYLRARFYAPEMNRFSQKDVLRGAATEPQSLNRYLYVQNDPVNFCDPSGEWAVNTRMADSGGGVRRISSAPTVVKPGVSTRAVTATPRNNTVSIPMTDTGTGGSRSAKTAAQTAANATTRRGTTAAGTIASVSTYAGSYIQRRQNTYVSSASASVMSPTSGAYCCETERELNGIGDLMKNQQKRGTGFQTKLLARIDSTLDFVVFLAVSAAFLYSTISTGMGLLKLAVSMTDLVPATGGLSIVPAAVAYTGLIEMALLTASDMKMIMEGIGIYISRGSFNVTITSLNWKENVAPEDALLWAVTGPFGVE